MTIRVREPASCDREAWDCFVRRHPHGSPFHLAAWKDSIEAAYGYQPACLLAEEGDEIRGVLPLFLVRNILVGKALISTPFAVYGGILAETPEARMALAERAKALAEEVEADYVELRNAYPEQCSGITVVPRYVTFTQEIGKDEEAILQAIPRKTRYIVRKSLRNGFVSRRQTTDFSAFELLYAENLRRLGTPCFPSRHFVELRSHFQDQIDVREVVLDGKVVAAALSFYFRDQVLPYYGAADPVYNALAPSSYLYFDLMRWAAENGYGVFDFGRSKISSGSYDFKAHWGMTMRPLPYEIHLVRRRDLPHYSPGNPRFRTAIRLWQKLPLPVTRVLGPPLWRLVP